MTTTINVLDIQKGTTVDGPGFRTSIYFAGCRHNCPECHNPDSWAFDQGTPTDIEELVKIIEEEDFDVTLSGGDPLYHIKEIATLIERIRSIDHSIWVYTGFTWDELKNNPYLISILSRIEVLVDGKYEKDRVNPDLLFRGSDNQRLIHIASTIRILPFPNAGSPLFGGFQKFPDYDKVPVAPSLTLNEGV